MRNATVELHRLHAQVHSSDHQIIIIIIIITIIITTVTIIIIIMSVSQFHDRLPSAVRGVD